MQLKPGVKLGGVCPELALAAVVVEATLREYGPVVVTSVLDGTHSDGSLHYRGRAMDLRSKHIAAHNKDLVLRALRVNLGSEFDVLLEGRGTENEHFHLEFQPKEHRT